MRHRRIDGVEWFFFMRFGKAAMNMIPGLLFPSCAATQILRLFIFMEVGDVRGWGHCTFVFQRGFALGFCMCKPD